MGNWNCIQPSRSGLGDRIGERQGLVHLILTGAHIRGTFTDLNDPHALFVIKKFPPDPTETHFQELYLSLAPFGSSNLTAKMQVLSKSIGMPLFEPLLFCH